jgi:hypothetical protein
MFLSFLNSLKCKAISRFINVKHKFSTEEGRGTGAEKTRRSSLQFIKIRRLAPNFRKTVLTRRKEKHGRNGEMEH